MGTYQLTINYPDMPVVLKTEAYSENDARSQVAKVRGVPLDWVSDVKELV